MGQRYSLSSFSSSVAYSQTICLQCCGANSRAHCLTLNSISCMSQAMHSQMMSRASACGGGMTKLGSSGMPFLANTGSGGFGLFSDLIVVDAWEELT
jgi:hypothetical protein